MNPEERLLSNFLDVVGQYMEGWHSYANVMDNLRLDKVCPEPHADFKKLLQLFNRALSPMHMDWFRFSFTESNLERSVVDMVLKTHCFKINSNTKNIFMGLLYVFSFTYSLLHYCEKNGLDGMLQQLRQYIKTAFLCLNSRFVSEGGWIGLRTFRSSENLPKILQFISDCYCEKAVFSTFVFITTSSSSCNISIGFHGRETINLMMNNVVNFERSVRDAFDREINSSLSYRHLVDIAFSKLRYDLVNGPFTNYLARDKARLAVDPTSPLSRI